MASNPFHLDEVFFEMCLTVPGKVGNHLPISPTSTLTSSTAYAFDELDLNEVDDTIVSDSSRLTDRYPAAYKDFYGMPSGAPCVYKSGSAWPEREGPQAQRIIREARPVYGHPIAPSWLKIGTEIYKFLDSCSVMWTSIAPIAFADAGEATPFCPLLIWIGVKRKSLLYDAAVAAAKGVKGILDLAGFPEIEVAFRESEVTRSVAGPKLYSFNPLADSIPECRKPFTPTLGLSVAPVKTPHFEGTGALYLRVSKDDDRVVLLTAAHVARPPVYSDKGISRKGASHPREEIVALGNMGYQQATSDIMATIGDLARSVEVWNSVLERLGPFVPGESPAVTRKRTLNRLKVEEATEKIDDLNKLHDEVTKRRTNPNQRIIGSVFHVEPIVVSDGPTSLRATGPLSSFTATRSNGVPSTGTRFT